MCGIFGVINGTRRIAIDPVRANAAAKLMTHRGPDAYGQWGVTDVLELAHLRLSIIDPTPDSNQPFTSTCGRYVLVFNGEIYNYIELRQDLIELGRKFRTSGDTEVLLEAYAEWGGSCVQRFNGDWAFAIYDHADSSLFCSRDRFGVKPFNYAVTDGQLVFASEIKSILAYRPELRSPNLGVIANYCRKSLGAEHADTWFKGIERLPPAHNLSWKDGEITLQRYWDYPRKTQVDIPLWQAVEEYREIFVRAVKLRMRSDVPVGTTLSSGIDSSSIVSVLRTLDSTPHNTFTATFAEDFDRREKSVYRDDVQIDEAGTVARLSSDLKLKSHFVESRAAGFTEELAHTIYHLESGHSAPSVVPLSRLLRRAREDVAVLLEGQGADELLAGYIINTFPALLLECVRRGRLRQAGIEFEMFRRDYSLAYAVKLAVRRFDSVIIERLYQHHTGVSGALSPDLRAFGHFDQPVWNSRDFSEGFNKVLARSHSRGLVNLLHYGDALSMANSIESRLPFLDVNLVEYVFSLPYHLKARNGYGKFIHRQAMKGIVPDYVLSNRLKFGFNTPLLEQFASLNSPANTILLSKRCGSRGLFDVIGLRDLIAKQISGSSDQSNFLFRLLSVELWCRQFLE